MTGNQYREALIELGVTQKAFGRWIGVHYATAKGWTRRGPPPPVARWVEFLLAHRRRTVTPGQLARIKAATKTDNWRAKLDLTAVRGLVGEVETVRQAIGAEPASWGPTPARPTVQALPRRVAL